MKTGNSLLLMPGLLIALSLAFCGDSPVPQTERIKTNKEVAQLPEGEYLVARVVDGDTVRLQVGQAQVVVRLIGINTPEVVDPRRPVQCFGREASKKAKELLTSKAVRLEKDSSQGEVDRYNRTLGYLFLPDGQNFNQLMIAEGYAQESTYRVPYKYQKEFKNAERVARREQKGLWSPDACGNK